MKAAFVVCVCAAIASAQSPAPTAACDTIAARVRVATDVTAGTQTVWSLVTSGRPPLIEVASVSEVSLGPNPDPDVRVEFEKRIRARYGNAEAVLKDLRSWDNFDILGLPGSRIRMLLRTGGTAQCESRYFFRVDTNRDVVRVPDPPEKSSGDFQNAICNNLGGWGYFGRVTNAEAFVEYHVAAEEESLRIVPLTGDTWQPACTISAQFLTSANSGARGRLEHLVVNASR